MKRIRIVLSIAFIIGLVLFQVKFVTENDNLNADITLSQKANAEINPGGIYRTHPTATSCGFHYTETYSYYGYKDGDDSWVVLLGTKVWVDGDLQSPFYDPYSPENIKDKLLSTNFSSSSTEIIGTVITCQSGNMSCTPGSTCP